MTTAIIAAIVARAIAEHPELYPVWSAMVGVSPDPAYQQDSIAAEVDA